MVVGTGERRGVPFRTLAWAGLALTAVAFIGAALAYFRLLHYRRCAVEHLPPRTEFAARLDVEQIVLFEPVRKHLLPLIDALPLAPAGASADRLARLRRDAGLNLGLDLRELLVATADRGQRWVLVLGGLFPRSGLVSAIERTLAAEGATGWTNVDSVLEWPAGVALGQAQDGALILASDRATLRESLSASSQFEALGFEPRAAGGAIVTGAGLSEWLWRNGPVRSLGAVVKLGNELEVDARLGFDDVQTARAFAERSSAATLASVLGPVTPSSGPSLPAALVESAEVSGTTLQLVAHVRQSELERAVRDLAAWVSRHW